LTVAILIPFVISFKFFLEKRAANILTVQDYIPLSHKLIVAWVYLLGAGNIIIIQGFAIFRMILNLSGNDGSPNGSGGIFYPMSIAGEVIDLLTALSILQLHNRNGRRGQALIERKMLLKGRCVADSEKNDIDVIVTQNNEDDTCEDIHEIKRILQHNTLCYEKRSF
jgi:hypothetical protein